MKSDQSSNKVDEMKSVEKAIHGFNMRMWNTMDEEELNTNVAEFQSYLKDVIHILPGPKHPAIKYYELRKKGKQVSSQNSNHKKSSNPERSTKRDRNKRKEAYLYQSIQFDYYNRRKKAVRKVFNDETRSCPISLDILKDHYQQSFGVENPMVDSGNIPATDDSTNVSDDWEMSLEDVEWAISRLNADSAPGPDGVIVRAIKIKCVSEILLKIFNRMASLGVVVKCLKKARTILIDKGGPVQEIKNWRPITILPIIRRIFEKVLERELRNVAIINTNQRGFMSMPGCAINITIVENALDLARSEKNDLFCVFVDVNQAYNNIGHNQIKECIGKMNVHDKIKHLVTECQLGNESSIEVGTDKSSCFTFKKGLLQGAPLSPLLYNIATNHIIDELTEEGLINNYGVKITPSIRMTALAFADDICLLSNSINSAGILFEIVNRRLSNLGMSLNVAKTQAIVIKKGVCCSDGFTLNGCSIVPVSEEKCVRYLGANFREQVMLDKEATIKNLGEKIDKVAKSPYLKADQKLKILNTYVWPVLTYKLQTTPLDRWSIPFVDDLDKMIRSAVKQILEIPKDVPDALIYTSRNVRGLQMF